MIKAIWNEKILAESNKYEIEKSKTQLSRAVLIVKIKKAGYAYND